jgi:glucose/arabinose dehydrogenase
VSSISHCHLFPNSTSALFTILFLAVSALIVYYLDYLSLQPASAAPSLRDPNLKVEVVAEGLSFPTTMAFLGPDDILVLEKNNGTVQRILNGTLLADPVLDVNVANKYERGMLGIAVLSKEQQQQQQKQGQETGITSVNNTNTNSTNNTNANATYVYLYYTETDVEGSDVCPAPGYCVSQNKPFGNRIYRYEWDNSTGQLVNPALILDLPANPVPINNGGKLAIGPGNNIYFTVGDLNQRSATQNFAKRTAYNETSGIYRITPDGRPVQPILGNEHPLDKYYAYGMRNSYGIDFDPVTGKLWDTEDGPAFGDEINLVEPGFNSGWRKVQGVWNITEVTAPGGRVNFTDLDNKVVGLDPVGLEVFGRRGVYSSPEFTWFNSTAPTAIVFLNSSKLGYQYENDIFVGDKQGYIYHFKLNQNRTGLLLEGPLNDKISNSPEETENIVFGEGFRTITDIQVGPHDGYLYVISSGAEGKIYRIVPAD